MTYSLSPLTSVLGLRRAKHLLRRASFSYSKDTLQDLSIMTPSEALVFLSIDSNDILSDPFEDLNNEYLMNATEGQRRAYVTAWWWYNTSFQNSIKHKLSYFIFTSFTVSNGNGAGPSIYFYDYVRLLKFYALGSIKC